MKTKKMSLAKMQGKLSRAEMKKIIAGNVSPGCGTSCGKILCHNNNSSGNCYCDGTETPCS